MTRSLGPLGLSTGLPLQRQDGAPSIGVRFRADAVDDARQAKLEIISGDGQSADKGDLLAEPLVVRVRTVRGFLIPGILLEFTGA